MNFIDRWIVERQIARAKKRPRQGFKPATFQGGSLFLPPFIGSVSPGGGGGGLGLTLFDSLSENRTVVTGTVETIIYSKSIPGNTIAAGKGLRIIHVLGDVDSTNLNPIPTYRIKMDGALLITVSIKGSETVGVVSTVIIDQLLFPFTAGGNNQSWMANAFSRKVNTLDPALHAFNQIIVSTFDMTVAHTYSITVQNQFATETTYSFITSLEIMQA